MDEKGSRCPTIWLPLGRRACHEHADATYLLRGRVAMIWPYDERCRLIGENVWEYDGLEHDLIKLDPDEMLTTQQAAELLEPYIKPLPPFDDRMLSRSR